MHKISNFIKENGLDAFKQLCYRYASTFEYSCILDSCSLNTGVAPGKYEFLAAFDAAYCLNSFAEVCKQQKSNWLFGVLSYDLKNQFENLSSSNPIFLNGPETLFFSPHTLIAIDKLGEATVLKGELESAFFESSQPNSTQHSISKELNQVDKDEYLDKIKSIHQLIREGEVYELNYCLNFKHTFQNFIPSEFHIELLQKSPVPMASYLKAEHLEMCGASMERFITKQGSKLISQPIKGTIRKGIDTEEDEKLILQLQESEKDRAENVMIVDLVRNDLSRICKTGSVQVEELFGIYSYLQVHQMISTISGELREHVSFADIMKALFPMGSMTGAPKISAMKYIDELENFKRGWYSGAVGYIDPLGDFDFNVVIRSLFCDRKSSTLSYCAGGAITIDSDPEKEWDEIKLKTKAIYDLLTN
ncbi:MAG: anthranilate synthase component I family protein [Bacteroidia bacterium]|nr:anthranilate synthase component I family protein [Bacteroidia bacterium]NNJ56218.1 anthranilate synthase component I family protein [Bacteroidia bacterium]